MCVSSIKFSRVLEVLAGFSSILKVLAGIGGNMEGLDGFTDLF